MVTVFENARIKVEVDNGWQVVITDKEYEETQITVSADGGGLYAESKSRYRRVHQHNDTAGLRVSGEG